MILYKNDSADNVIGKRLTELMRFKLRIPSNVDLLSPKIVLSGFNPDKVLGFNYCYIEPLKRYYFVKDMVVMGKVTELYLEVDVLETYREQILGAEVNFKSEIKEGDYGAFTGNRTPNKIINDYLSDRDLDNEESIVAVTLGGN